MNGVFSPNFKVFYSIAQPTVRLIVIGTFRPILERVVFPENLLPVQELPRESTRNRGGMSRQNRDLSQYALRLMETPVVSTPCPGRSRFFPPPDSRRHRTCTHRKAGTQLVAPSPEGHATRRDAYRES